VCGRVQGAADWVARKPALDVVLQEFGAAMADGLLFPLPAGYCAPPLVPFPWQ
jgi:hypothetical protein